MCGDRDFHVCTKELPPQTAHSTCHSSSNRWKWNSSHDPVLRTGMTEQDTSCKTIFAWTVWHVRKTGDFTFSHGPIIVETFQFYIYIYTHTHLLQALVLEVGLSICFLVFMWWLSSLLSPDIILHLMPQITKNSTPHVLLSGTILIHFQLLSQLRMQVSISECNSNSVSLFSVISCPMITLVMLIWISIILHRSLKSILGKTTIKKSGFCCC